METYIKERERLLLQKYQTFIGGLAPSKEVKKQNS